MNTEIIEVINDFNQTLVSLANDISAICPNSIIGNNIKDIEKTIKKKENLTKFIDIFCIKVLKYKDEIDKGNDDFFIKKDYSDDLKEDEMSQLDIVNAIKEIYIKLNKTNKEIVIQNMQILCELAQMYFQYIYNNMNN